MSPLLQPWIRCLCRTVNSHKIPPRLSMPTVIVTQRTLRTGSLNCQKEYSAPVVDITRNPYYEKYIKKFETLKVTDPDLYDQKVLELTEKLKRKPAPPPTSQDKEATQKKPAKKKSVSKLVLNDIVKLDLLRQQTPEEIEKIWMQFHSVKDCIYGAIKEMDYDEVMSKSGLCPAFLYLLPRQHGYEFFYQQFSGREIYFTPLALYQKYQENAPPCLTLQHFTDLKEEKGLVLMSGDYDSNILDKQMALNLARQLTMFYGRFAAERFTLVRIFNYVPEKFDFNDLITEYKGAKKFLESSILECK